ncbi:MAG: hypothetical protein EXR72_08035 [Myxococcales bacterium]|nr:hypothetical protein [Myxococcales bacterium]
MSQMRFVPGLLLVGVAAGCGSSLQVVREAEPSPFAGVSSFDVESITVGDVRLPENPVLPETLDEPRMNRVFLSTLVTRGVRMAPGDFVIRAHVGKAAPRWIPGGAGGDRNLKMWVGIFDRDDHLQDGLESRCSAELYDCAAHVAGNVAGHLHKRIGG